MPSTFNLAVELQFKAPRNNSQLRKSIEDSLRGLKGNIDVQVKSAGLNSLNTQLRQLEKTLRSVQGDVGKATTSLRGLEGGYSKTSRGVNQFNTAHSTATTRLREFTKESRAASVAQQQLGRQLGDQTRRLLTYSLAAGGIYGLVRAMQAGVREAINFEREMVKLTQQGAAVQEVREMERAITKLSSSLGVSSHQLAQTAVTFQQTGMEMKDVEKATEAIAKAALAPNFGSMKEATEGAISMMRVFNVDAKNMEKSLMAINSVAGAFASESRDLIVGIQRAGASFAAAGGNLNQLLALMSTVRSTTRESAESIATGLKTIFTRLERRGTIESLKQLGIQLTRTREEAKAMGDAGLEGQFIGAYEAIQKIGTALKGLRSTDIRYMGIVEELGGYRQVSKLLPMLQQLTETQKAYMVAQYGGINLTNVAAQAQQTLAVKIDKLKESFMGLFRTIVGSSAFQAFSTMLLKTADHAVQLADKLTPLLPIFIGLGAAKLFQGFGKGIAGHTVSSRRFATGGSIPGSGNTDNTLIAATPGEFVIRKQAAKSLGPTVLGYMNRTGRIPGIRGYEHGGDVEEPGFSNVMELRAFEKTNPGAGQLFHVALQAALSKTKLTDRTPIRVDPTGKTVKFLGLHDYGAYDKAEAEADTIFKDEKPGQMSKSEAAQARGHGTYEQLMAEIKANPRAQALFNQQFKDVEAQFLRATAGYPGFAAEHGDMLRQWGQRSLMIAALGHDPNSDKDFTPGNFIHTAIKQKIGDIIEKAKKGGINAVGTEEQVRAKIAATSAQPQVLSGYAAAGEEGPGIFGDISAAKAKRMVDERRAMSTPTPVPDSQQSAAVGATNAELAAATDSKTQQMMAARKQKAASTFTATPAPAAPPTPPGIPPAVAAAASPAPGPFGRFSLPMAPEATTAPAAAPVPKGGPGTQNAGLNPELKEATHKVVQQQIFGLMSEEQEQARIALQREAAHGGGGPGRTRPGSTFKMLPADTQNPHQRFYSIKPEFMPHDAINSVAGEAAYEANLQEEIEKNRKAVAINNWHRALKEAKAVGGTGAYAGTVAPERVAGDYIPEIPGHSRLADRILNSRLYKTRLGGKLLDSIPILGSFLGKHAALRELEGMGFNPYDDTPTETSYIRDKETLAGLAGQGPTRYERFKGLMGRTGRRISGSRFVGGLRGIGKGLDTAIGRGAMFALPSMAAYLEHLAGDEQNAIANGHETRYKVAQGATGALSMGATGAMVGSMFLPGIGTAIGGIGGALAGLVMSISDASDKLRDAKLGKAVQDFAANLELIKSGRASTGTISSELTNIRGIRAGAMSKATSAASNFFGGFNNEEFLTNYHQEIQTAFGPKSGDIAQILNQQAEEIGKTHVGKELKDFEDILSKGNKGLNEEYISILADVKQVSRSEVIKGFREVAAASQAKTKNDNLQKSAEQGETRQLAQYQQLALAAEQATQGLAHLQSYSNVVASQFSGQFNAIHVAGGIGTGIGLLGGPNRTAFRQSLSAVSSPFGRMGEDFQRSGVALDELSRNLPDAIATAMRESPTSGQDLPLRIMDTLKTMLGGPKAINGNQDMMNALSVAAHGLNKMETDTIVSKTQSGDVHGLVQQLLEPLSAPFKQTGAQLSRLLTERANEFTSGLHEAARMMREITEGNFHVAQARLAETLKANEFSAQATGRRHGALDLITLEQLQAPFLQRQQALAGNIGMNPAAIGTALTAAKASLKEAIEEQNKIARTRGHGYEAASERVQEMTTRVANLNDALNHLRDTTQTAAAAQEKLNKNEEDRVSRLSFGERYMTSDIGGRSQIHRGLRLIQLAHAQGDVATNFSPMNQRLLLETLSSLGGAKIFGNDRASDIRENILNRSYGGVFAQTKADKQERDTLQKSILEAFETARKAEEELQKQHFADQKTLLETQKSLQKEFFDKLGQHMVGDELRRKEAERVTLTAKKPAMAKKQADYNLIREAGAIGSVKSLNRYQSALQLFKDMQEQDLIRRENIKPFTAAHIGSSLADIIGSHSSGFMATGGTKGELLNFFSRHGLNENAAFNATLSLQKVFGQSNYNAPASVLATKAQQEALRLIQSHRTQLAVDARYKMDGINQKLLGMDFGANQVRDINQVFASGKGQGLIDALGRVDAATWEKLPGDIKALDDELKNLDVTILGMKIKMNPSGYIPPPHFAQGGHVGGPKGTDTVPAWLSPGEYVVRASKAAQYRGLLDKINNGNVNTNINTDFGSGSAAYADGGVVYAKDGLRRVPHPIHVPRAHLPVLNPVAGNIIGALAKQWRVTPATAYQYMMMAPYIPGASNGPLEELPSRLRLGIREQRRAYFQGVNQQMFGAGAGMHGRPGFVGPRQMLSPKEAHERMMARRAKLLSPQEMRKKLGELRAQQTEALMASGKRYYARHGVAAPGATSLDDIRRRANSGPVGKMAPMNYLRIGPSGHSRHYSEGGEVRPFIGGSSHGGTPQFHESMDKFHANTHHFAGAALALSKAMEAMPSTVSMNAQHTHVHHHMGLGEGGEKFAKSMEEFMTGHIEGKFMEMLKKHFPQAGIV